jgi:hypothetical protein
LLKIPNIKKLQTNYQQNPNNNRPNFRRPQERAVEEDDHQSGVQPDQEIGSPRLVAKTPVVFVATN